MMALRGTLEDLAIIDLIQFPHTGRKTGQLVINGNDGEATLSYENGSLVHVRLGDVSGMEALVRVVDWSEGAFEFNPDAKPETRSIELDLHRAIMQALKLRDELKMEEEKKRSQTASPPEGGDEALRAKLSEFVDATDFALHACAVGPDGQVLASVNAAEESPEGMEDLLSTLQGLVQYHPRGSLNRILLEDELGTVALVRLPDGGSLIVVAREDASLGAVSMGVGRLATGLA